MCLAIVFSLYRLSNSQQCKHISHKSLYGNGIAHCADSTRAYHSIEFFPCLYDITTTAIIETWRSIFSWTVVSTRICTTTSSTTATLGRCDNRKCSRIKLMPIYSVIFCNLDRVCGVIMKIFVSSGVGKDGITT